MKLNNKTSQMFVGALALMMVASAFTAVGMIVGIGWNSRESAELPVQLHADSAARGKGMSFATGMIDEGVEGLFVLDHLTGNIQCWVLNKRTGDIGGIYSANVGVDLELEKVGDSDFVMTTGRFDFNPASRRGNIRPAECLCYVGDGNTGKVVGYGLEFNPQVIAQGGAQQGELQVVCKGVTREATQIRDQ